MRYIIILFGSILWGLSCGMSQNAPMAKGMALHQKYVENPTDPKLLDSAKHYMKRGISLHKEEDEFIEWVGASQLLQKVYRDMIKVGKSDKIQIDQFWDSTLQAVWRDPQNEEEWIWLGRLYRNRAYYATQLGDYYTAKTYYEEYRKISEKYMEDYAHIVNYIYNPLGKIYLYLGDYNQAQFYTKKVINYLPIASSKYAESISDLALIYQAEKKYDNARIVYEQELKKANIEEDVRALIHTNLGAMFVDRENWKNAIFHLNQAISIYNNNQNSKEALQAYRLLGHAAVMTADYDKAKKYLDRSIEIALEEDGVSTIYSPEFALIHSYIGYLNQSQNKYQAALQSYQNALHFLIPELDSIDIYQSPHIEHLHPEPLILDILEHKGDAFYELYRENKEPENLMYALHAYQMATKMEEVLQLSYDNEAAKLDLMAKSHERTETALEIAYELYQLTGDEAVTFNALGLAEQEQEQDYLTAIFNISESSKSTVLFESLKELEAQMLSKLPDSSEAELYRLKAYWRYCQRQYQAFKQSQANMAEMKEWEDKMVKSRDSYQQFIQSLEEEQQDYVEIKNNWEPLSIGRVQNQLLEKNQALLEYFVGEHYIYLFIINKQETHFLRLDCPLELRTWVEGMRDNISSYDPHNPYEDSKVSAYISYSTKLYNCLLKPIEDAGISLPTKLKIVPDDVLGYLPFEALLTNAPENKRNFKSYDYLLKEHQLSYAYSVRLLEQMQSLIHSDKRLKPFLGVAPVFENSPRFPRLPHSMDEVQQLCEAWRGKDLIGDMATKQNFLQYAPDYEILHIYSHAVANSDVPHTSHIGFYDGNDTIDEDKSLLHLADIYAMKLRASMVVLSACETQTGLLHKGEGLMSLARGFMYAGSKSVVGTRWKVNSTSTSKIMDRFYTELSEGATKDAALTQAKLFYLFEDEETDKNQAHPYFWAAYAPIGDMQAIASPLAWGRVLGGIAGLLVLLMVFWYWRGRKETKKPFGHFFH